MGKKRYRRNIKEDTVSVTNDDLRSNFENDIKELQVEHDWELFNTSLKLLQSYKSKQNEEIEDDKNKDKNETRKKELNFICKTLKSNSGNKKKASTLKIAQKEVEPPSNFRDLSILPTVEDLKRVNPFIRRNIVQGKYNDVDHYLDVQFRLFREDYISPLREGIRDYHKELEEMKYIYSHRFKTVFVYKNVKVLNPELDDGFGLIFNLKFEKFPSSFIWDNSKRLQEGTLLCLSLDNFINNFIFATVMESKNVADGKIKIHFEESIDFTYENPASSYMMLETCGGYFESYRHTLNILKELNEDNFPLKEYIIVHRKKVKAPCYLTKNSTYNFRPLLEIFLEGGKKYSEDDKCKSYCTSVENNLNYDSSTKELKTQTKYAESLGDDNHGNNGWLTSDDEGDEFYDKDCGWTLDEDECEKNISRQNSVQSGELNFSVEKVPILKYSKWPSKEFLKLDRSQYEVLKAALTKEFTIIQGPPGTGKTFMGLKIVKLLLYNSDLWHPKDKPCPILISCYTNHALDQFLERILEFTDKIVRVGSQSESEVLEKYKLSELRGTFDFPNSNERKQLEKKRKQIKNQVHICYKIIEAASTIIFPLSLLQKYMEENHYNTIINTYKNDGIRSNIEKWLEIPYDDDIQNSYNLDVLDSQCIKSDDEICSWIPSTQIAEIISKSSWNEYRSHKHEDHILKNMKCDDLENNNDRVMTEEEAKSCKPANELEIKDRWKLYRFWVAKFIDFVKEQIQIYQKEFDKIFNRFKKLGLERDVAILQENHVVGMTCTGAAKFHDLIEAVGPQIIIIEEAAEVLETHLITSLTTSIKHIIMIGDHQQLQPLPTVHELAEKCEMKVSLFERMVRNNIDCYTLTSQHRMRRSIAQLLVPHIYKELYSDESVDKYEDIKGMEKNVFFIEHSSMEKESVSSYCNEHEAKFIVQLSKYLLFQGYRHDQITILATYSAQLKCIKDEIKKIRDENEDKRFQNDIEHLKVTSVDNYQGEENDIILISFVRSNYEGKIGFLNKPNRVCVALSRAKKGLYCIGNFDLLSSVSELWKDIVSSLKNDDLIDSSVNLICQKHSITTNVRFIRDFKRVSDGGCEEKCGDLLACGHICKKNCHVVDVDHQLYKCEDRCLKKCRFNHPCKKKCHQECGDCKVIRIAKLVCGHPYPVPCHIENPEDFKCQKPCEKILKCGHICDKRCSDTCEPCLRIVPKTYLDCKHTIMKKCYESLEGILCSEPCLHFLQCGHPCPSLCGKRPCPEKCERIVVIHLTCGHVKEQICSSDKSNTFCNAPCCAKLPCGHTCSGNCSRCKIKHKKCFAVCGKRLFNGMKCRLLCGHDGICNADCENKTVKNFKQNSNTGRKKTFKDGHKVNKWYNN